MVICFKTIESGVVDIFTARGNFATQVDKIYKSQSNTCLFEAITGKLCLTYRFDSCYWKV